MKKLRIVLSLPQDDNYQREQAKSALESAARLGVELKILQANHDAVNQSQQLLEIVQSRKEPRTDAIMFEPLTATALARVGEAAIAAGIGWVVLNCDVEYLSALRSKAQVPVFSVTLDHNEIGRIQGKQFTALLPDGGTVLYVQGPATSSAARQRTLAMESARAENIKLKTLRSPWSESAAAQAVSAWLKLSTSRASTIDLVGCQADGIAMGARKALGESGDASERDQWLMRPFTGVDALRSEGQAWVDQGTLAATVVSGTTARMAMEMVYGALQGSAHLPERTVIEARSYPSLDRLTQIGAQRTKH